MHLPLSTLTLTNRDVNREITFHPSTSWIANSHHQGDCKAFALAKYMRLRTLGVPSADLHLVIVLTPWGEKHALLEVDTDHGRVVLDSLSPWVEDDARVFTPGGYTKLAELDTFTVELLEKDQ